MTRKYTLGALMFAVLLLIMTMGLSAAMAQGTLAALEITNATFTACDGKTLEGVLQVVAKDGDGNVINSASAVSMLLHFEADSGVVGIAAVSLQAGDAVPFAVSSASGTLTYAQVYATAPDGSARSNTVQIRCDGTITNLGGGGLLGIDDRINRSHGDLINVLYVRADAQGAVGIQVYRVEGKTGVYVDMFTASDFAPYLRTPPTQNTKIATLDRSTLYALASGEFQIAIGPDVEGKTYNVIFSGMPPKNIRFSTLNLYVAQGQ